MYKSSIRYIFLLLCLLLQQQLFAQWTTQTAINTLAASSSSSDMKSLSTSTGYTYVVFWKVVAGPTNYELRLQVLNDQGVQQLGPDGILVSNALPMSTSTAIMKLALDHDENLMIGVTGTNGALGYAFKLNTQGNHLWAPTGIALGPGYVVTCLGLSNGQTIIAWLNNNQTNIQKYTASGTPVWTAPVVVTSQNAGNKAPADLFELSNDNFLLVFHQYSFGISSTLYAQKYNGVGSPLWSNAVQLSNKATAWNTLYSATQDGDLVYYGYKASSGSHFDSYLQRINPDGTLPWGINGKDFSTQVFNQEMDTKIAFETGSNYIWSICNYTNPNQSATGVYVQKFDKTTGSRLLTDTAKVIYPIGSSKVNASDFKLFNGDPAFLLKDGYDNGATPTTLHACLLNQNGTFQWVYETKPMATYSANKSRIQFSKYSTNKAVAVFIEEKTSGTPKIYAQSVNIIENLNNTGTAIVSACDSFTWINNITYTQSNFVDTFSLTNVNGGDSLITLNLTITPSATNVLNMTTCDAYTWNGNTYTTSGTYVGSTNNCLTNILQLVITPSSDDTTFINSCTPINWNGNTFNTSGTYQGPTVNCITEILALNMIPMQYDTTYVIQCAPYFWNAETYTTSGTYTGTTTGCTTQILSLILEPNILSISESNNQLQANVNSIGNNTPSFQWVDCQNNFSQISNATNVSFSPTDAGIFAVVVSNAGCTDTSSCFEFTDVNVQEFTENQFVIYPNPTSASFRISTSISDMNRIQICDNQGRIVQDVQLDSQMDVIDISALQNGTYFVRMAEYNLILPLVKQ